MAEKDGGRSWFMLGKRLVWPGLDYGLRARYALRRRLLGGPDVSTLDVGCGTGCMAIAAARRGGTAVGISTEPAYLAIAAAYRDAIGLDALRCRFEEINVYDLDRPGLGTFDQVILFEVLEHLESDELALSLIARRLKPRGWLHLTVPNRDHHRAAIGLTRHEDGGHVRHGYDIPTLEAMLRRHGLEPIDRLGVGGLGTVLAFRAVSAVLRLGGRPGRMAGLAVFVAAWPLVKLLDCLPARPWSLYVLAAKRDPS